MAKIVLKLQKPSIELIVKVKDAAKAVDTFKAGFKRYKRSEAQAKFKEIQALAEQEQDNEDSTASDDLLRNEILYLKDIEIEVEDDSGNAKTIKVADTRSAKPIAGLWENGEECLEVLTTMFLDSTPYRSALLKASTQALFNMDYESAEVKN